MTEKHGMPKQSEVSKELIYRFKHFLEGINLDIDHPAFSKALEFLRKVPGSLTANEINSLRSTICKAFSISDEELTGAVLHHEGLLDKKKSEEDSIFGKYNIQESENKLRSFIPQRGFLPDYLSLVERTEPPLAYHVFSGLLACGAMLGGKVWMEMGVYHLFPPLAIMLLGPSGIKKTSSANIAIGLVEQTGLVKIYSEMATPQALAEDMADMPQGIIYAPELTATLLTKDRFMDGMLAFLTRALDHPRPVLKKKTVKGGTIIINEPTVSMITCSTLDWLVEKTPEGTFGGGFMARNILVMQDDSPRSEPRPPTITEEAKNELIKQLCILSQYAGKIPFSDPAEKAYHEWYNDSKPKWKNPEVELMGTIYQRRADNVQRVACILHLSHCETQDICLSCFEHAAHLLDWTDQFTIPALKRVFKSGTGKDQEIVLRSIQSMGGVVEHSQLVRRLQYRMNAQQLKVVLASLIDARQVEERHTKIQHTYFLRD
jgi:hypothetical protein